MRIVFPGQKGDVDLYVNVLRELIHSKIYADMYYFIVLSQRA